ncbi:ribosomal-protein-alanine N-acetyltransferase [Candidatus Aquiluna sp. UB-MaderosW2red]|nr:ribosomal-protein-alanine N-acetyltransferase [Candidatus Aquiluna sp. UB-MaderosW2red]
MPLTHQEISLRSVRRRDIRTLERLLVTDREWLRPWEASTPGIRYPLDVRFMVGSLIAQARNDSGLGLIIEYQGQIVGQINVAGIQRGSLSSATIGYWISKKVAGNNITPIAVALTIDYLFLEAKLHRVEIDIRPENTPSLRVVEKLGLREEGLKKRFIHIDGDWRDHRIFAITSEEISGSLLNRL